MAERLTDPSSAVEVRYPEPEIEGVAGFKIIRKGPDVPHGARTSTGGSVRKYLAGVAEVGRLKGKRLFSTPRRSPEDGMQYESHPVRDQMHTARFSIFEFDQDPIDWDEQSERVDFEATHDDLSEE